MKISMCSGGTITFEWFTSDYFDITKDRDVINEMYNEAEFQYFTSEPDTWLIINDYSIWYFNHSKMSLISLLAKCQSTYCSKYI